MFSFSRDLQQQKLEHANVQEICRSVQNRWVRVFTFGDELGLA
jgi:hypothetical protein